MLDGAVDAHQVLPGEIELSPLDAALRSRLARAVALDPHDTGTWEKGDVKVHCLLGRPLEHEERRN